MDFSEAERSGFILGYIEFWALRPEDKRTPDALREVAEGLLKGCQEHYRAGVTRISRMIGVIGEGNANAFKARAMGLLDAPSSEAFIQQALHLVRDFPNLKSWMEWWARPSHAAMLFKTERKMDINVWESIPDTNNAEESMNWKFYAACGRNHSFLEGLRSLFAVAAYYQRLFDAESSKYFCYHFHTGNTYSFYRRCPDSLWCARTLESDCIKYWPVKAQSRFTSRG